MHKPRLINKQGIKHLAGKCYFCDEDDYDLLDVHRIIPGSEHGVYSDRNSLVVCCGCHRLIHSSKIKIDRKYLCTNGKWILHYWKNNEEKWE